MQTQRMDCREADTENGLQRGRHREWTAERQTQRMDFREADIENGRVDTAEEAEGGTN